MKQWFQRQPERVKIPILIGLMLCAFAVMVIIDQTLSITPSARSSTPVVQTDMSPPESVPTDTPTTSPHHRYEQPSSRDRDRQAEVDGMAQAARDAGYDDATSDKLGREAAALCNGNPECLK